MMMSLTSELTMAPKATPMITPKARSMTLPRIAKSRNSFSMALFPLGGCSCPQARSAGQALQGADHAVDIRVLHGRIERDREHAGVIGLGAGKADIAIKPAVIGLPVDRDIMDLGPDSG